MTENKDALREVVEEFLAEHTGSCEGRITVASSPALQQWQDFASAVARATPPVKQDAMREALEKAANAWDAFGVARSAMNASIPAVNSTPAERALYDERYKADHEAQREHWRAAVDLAQSARSILAALSAPNVAGERELPPCPSWQKLAATPYTPQPESVDDVRAALAEAIEALKPFAEKEMYPDSGNRPDDWREPFGFALGDLRRAAQVAAKYGDAS